MDRSVEGIWSVEFVATSHQHGCGAIVFQDGRAFGCDATHYYKGRYRVCEGVLDCSLTITHDRGPATWTGARREMEVSVTGEVCPEGMRLFASANGRPAERFFAYLNKRADIPAR